MSATTNILAVLAIGGGIAFALAVFKARRGAGSLGAASFKPRALLTANEHEFLLRLEAAAPELRFCPQVSMGAVLDPAVPRKDGKNYFRLRGMFSQKIIDFVAQQRSDGAILAIIELDDRTHSGSKDEKRDSMLESAGYRIIRWHSKNKPDEAAIRAALFPAMPAQRGAISHPTSVSGKSRRD